MSRMLAQNLLIVLLPHLFKAIKSALNKVANHAKSLRWRHLKSIHNLCG